MLLLSEHTTGPILTQDIPALKDTLTVREGLGIAGKDIMDRTGPIGPLQVGRRVREDIAAGRGDDGDVADEDVGLGTGDVEDLDELVEDVLDAPHREEDLVVRDLELDLGEEAEAEGGGGMGDKGDGEIGCGGG